MINFWDINQIFDSYHDIITLQIIKSTIFFAIFFYKMMHMILQYLFE